MFICGEPVHVRNDAGPGDMEEARARLEKTLIEITSAADNRFKK